VQVETGVLVLVISGRDPGIAPTDGVRGDPRIKSGDDEDGAVHRTMAISAARLILMPLGRGPVMTRGPVDADRMRGRRKP
jgi:hypothetical protein